MGEQKGLSPLGSNSAGSNGTGGGGHRYAAADEELAGLFTSALGLKGQSYDPVVLGAFDAHAAAERMLKAMRWLAAGGSPMAWHDRVVATLVQLPIAQRRTLTLVYAPHAWPATWMASALACPWGAGSMAALALTLPRASSEDGRGVHRWLLDVDRPLEQERRRREAVCARFVRDGESLRMVALAAYETLRVARVDAERAEKRRSRAEREAKNAARYAEMLGMTQRISRARFERRLRRAA